ncbi:MAG: PilT/PilU family type 4a pilus ATPase [Peptococcaceae bacterium]|nr:PilT/PilU family type 4a pilus ATPase [Peptococcaceae bacterium]
MITDLRKVLEKTVAMGASDVFIVAGQPISCKVDGEIANIDPDRVMPDSACTLIGQAYQLANRPIKRFEETGDDDLSVSLPGLARFRINTYKQRGSYSAVIRIISFDIPDFGEMKIPAEILKIAEEKKGIVLVTGPAGSGKSTTLACVIDRINKTRNCHIITLEDPIEFLYKNDKSIISQREVELDTVDYVTALRASLRQAPDVILLGEMRDLETIGTALTAAETGHLMLSTLHTLGAANTVDRIIDVFPPAQQAQVRIQLSMLLRTVVSQQLVPNTSSGVSPAFEIMHVNNAIRNMIRESKTHQIDTVITSASSEGMISMDSSLLELYKNGVITAEAAMSHSLSHDTMLKRIKTIG